MIDSLFWQVFSLLLRLLVPVMLAVFVSSLCTGFVARFFKTDDASVGFVINLVVMVAALFLAAGFYQEGLVTYAGGVWRNTSLYR